MLKREFIEKLSGLRDGRGIDLVTVYLNPCQRNNELILNFEFKFDERFKEVYTDYNEDIIYASDIIYELFEDDILSDVSKENESRVKLITYRIIALGNECSIVVGCPYIENYMKSCKFSLDIENIIMNLNKITADLVNNLNKFIDKCTDFDLNKRIDRETDILDMELTSVFAENKAFERVLRSTYNERVCDIIIDWTDEVLGYIFKEGNKYGVFNLCKVNQQTDEIECTNEEYTLEKIIECVIRKMKNSLKDNLYDDDTRENAEEELELLSNVLNKNK